MINRISALFLALLLIGCGRSESEDKGSKGVLPEASKDESGQSMLSFGPESWSEQAPPSIDGIKGAVLWLRADKDVTVCAAEKISAWKDCVSATSGEIQSGPLYLADGINEQPALQFDSKLQLELPLPEDWPESEFTIFIVSRNDHTPKRSNNILYAHPDQKGNRFLIHMPFTHGPNKVYSNVGNTKVEWKDDSKEGTPNIWEFSMKADEGHSIYRNGTQKAHSGATALFKPGNRTLLLGNNYGGKVAEIIVCRQKLSAEERQAVFPCLSFGILHSACFSEATFFSLAACCCSPWETDEQASNIMDKLNTRLRNIIILLLLFLQRSNM